MPAVTFASLSLCLKLAEKDVRSLLKRKAMALDDLTYLDVRVLVIEHFFPERLGKKRHRWRRRSNKWLRQRADLAFRPLYMTIFEKYGCRCSQCGSTQHLTVHHKDGIHDNMDEANLVLLCWECHRHEHLEAALIEQKESCAAWGYPATTDYRGNRLQGRGHRAEGLRLL